MPIEDKARLLCGRSPFSVGGLECEGIKIPVLNMQDGGTGINYEQLFQDRQNGEAEGFYSRRDPPCHFAVLPYG